MTKEEFIVFYCKGSASNITPAELERNGLEARPCDCGDPYCHRWQMVRTKNEETDV